MLLVERDEPVEVYRHVHLGRPFGRVALPDEGGVDPVCVILGERKRFLTAREGSRVECEKERSFVR